MDLAPRQLGKVVAVYVPATNLDFDNVADFQRSLAAAVEGTDAVVLNMQQVQFIDSLGLVAILAALRNAASLGVDLRPSGVTPPVAGVMRLVRWDQIVHSFPTEAEAAASFG